MIQEGLNIPRYGQAVDNKTGDYRRDSTYPGMNIEQVLDHTIGDDIQ
jgi:hypothetical protein